MSPLRRLPALLGALTVAVALAGPLDALAHRWFAGHMLQHLSLTHLAAPLLLLGGLPQRALWALPLRFRRRWGRRLALGRRRLGPAGPVAVVLAHVVVLMVWHVPPVYDLAVEEPLVHAVEHLSMLGSALGFWAVLGAGARRPAPLGALLAFVASLALGALAALLAFVPEPLYAAHAASEGPWGLSALGDQQLGGMLMWIPGGLVYLGASAGTIVRWIGVDERRQATVRPR